MKNICVYCGSRSGNHPAYRDAAEQLGAALVMRKLGLVYGGASIGIMGVLANAVMAQGGKVIGVIPEVLVEKEVSHPQLTELKVVDSMHARKALMAELADGFIALPGGLGTLEELFEILTWAQLGLHQKPCVLLNVNGYYDALLAFLAQAVAAEFVSPKHRSLLLVADCPRTALEKIIDYRAPKMEQWLGVDNT